MSHRLAKSGRYGAGQIDAANVAFRKELEKLDRGNRHNDGAEQSSAADKVRHEGALGTDKSRGNEGGGAKRNGKVRVHLVVT